MLLKEKKCSASRRRSERHLSHAIRVACVGDSITYGLGVENREENSYPTLLSKFLGKNYETKNFGVSGATLLKKGGNPYWKLPQFRAATQCAPRIVVLALGTNDSKPVNWGFKSEFAADLRSMIEHFRKLPTNPQVWVCLPPPVISTDSGGINEAVVSGEIMPLIRQVTKELNVPVIDLHASLSNHPEFFPDGIHPNAAGARVIAQTVFADLRKNQAP